MVFFRFAGLRSAGKTVRSRAGGRRSTPFTGAGDRPTPAAPRPRSSSSSVTSPPAESLDLVFHPRPGRREHVVSALLEARLPALPAACCEPEAVDEDDGGSSR